MNSFHGWISVEDALPENDEPVLAIKQLKDGRRDICIARCFPDHPQYDVATGDIVRRPYWVCGGNNNIVYWQKLPEMPEEAGAGG